MSTGWTLGLILGVVVILIAAAIVITIVMLARRIADQARTAVGLTIRCVRADNGASPFFRREGSRMGTATVTASPTGGLVASRRSGSPSRGRRNAWG